MIMINYIIMINGFPQTFNLSFSFFASGTNSAWLPAERHINCRVSRAAVDSEATTSGPPSSWATGKERRDRSLIGKKILLLIGKFLGSCCFFLVFEDVLIRLALSEIRVFPYFYGRLIVALTRLCPICWANLLGSAIEAPLLQRLREAQACPLRMGAGLAVNKMGFE